MQRSGMVEEISYSIVVPGKKLYYRMQSEIRQKGFREYPVAQDAINKRCNFRFETD